jgi:hypothetical protein
LVVGAALVGVVIVVTRSSGHPSSSGSAPGASPASTSTTAAGPTDPGARQLIALLTGAGKLVFHARYQVTAAQAQAVLELWHSPPNARLDETETGGGNTIQSTQITDGTNEVACQRAAAAAWTCVKSGLDPSKNPGDVVFGNLNRFLAEASYAVTDATVADLPARCFTGSTPLPAAGAGAPAPTSPPRICTTPAGIPLLIDTGDGPVTATSIDTTVPATAFTPPAQPVGG